jgi:hypothetical protein
MALRIAVRAVLETPRYRLNAARMADVFAAIDTRTEILRTVNRLTKPFAESNPLRYDVVGLSLTGAWKSIAFVELDGTVRARRAMSRNSAATWAAKLTRRNAPPSRLQPRRLP